MSMDDSKTQQVQQNQSTQQTSVQPTPQINPSQATHVSSGGKEKSPLPSLSPAELVTPSTPELVIPQELKEHMEATPVTPALPNDVQNAGVKLAKEATPITSAGDDSLGMQTAPSVLMGIKKAHSNIKDSIRWLAELVGLAQKKRDYEIMKGGKE